MDLEFTYLNQPPSKFTFEQPLLKLWVEKHCRGKVLNLFAGKIRLNVNELRIDIDSTFKPDFCGDAYEFVKNCRDRFDTIILDPPYNLRKAREKYSGRWIGSLTKIKNLIPRIHNIGGSIIHCGYDSVGMGKQRGYIKKSICLVCHNGDHNDTICLEEEKNQDLLFYYEP